MKKIFFFILSVIMTCYVTAQQRFDITKPMFGEAEKDERYQKFVDNSRKAAIEQFGSIDSAVMDFTKKAWLYFMQNDLETSMRRFNQAWLLNDEFPDAYFGFAGLLEMHGNSQEALRFYFLGSEKDKDNYRTIICFKLIAECKEKLNDLSGAVTALAKIRVLKPDDVFIYKKSGYLYMLLGENTFALEAFAKAVELDPDDPITFYNRAFLRQNMDDDEKAIADFTRCIILDPTYVSAYINRGILEMKRDNYDAGKQDFETGIKLDNESGEIRRLLGIAKLSLEDMPGACEDFKTAKKLGDTVVDELINEYCKE